MSRFRWLAAALVALAFAPVAAQAQEPATITGRVTNAAGAPEAAVSVRIDALNVGTQSGADGAYRLVVPASRIRAGQAVRITASRVGLSPQTRTVTLTPGATLTQNFQLGADVLQLEGLVAVGQGATTTRERAVSAPSTVAAQEITRSREVNVVSALAGKAPNVLVTSSSGDPGSGAYIQIRGAASVEGGTQPLFVVDGTVIDNSTNYFGGAETAGTFVPGNRAMDINPSDIERVEVLKGGAATALYGAQGANGVILITTKSGRAGQTRMNYSFSVTRDEVSQLHPLQTEYGQGWDGNAINSVAGDTLPKAPGTNLSPSAPQSWGPRLPDGTQTFDHASEVYKDATRMEHNFSLSGGDDRTNYYLSLSRLGQDGVIVGPQGYDRTSVRLKGTHSLRDDLRVGGNISYTESAADYVDTGSNISGIQLGALRTPPEFNNCRTDDGYDCYLTPQGYHFAYRGPNPQSIKDAPIYDNPFWVANEIRNSSDVSRTFGNVNVDYNPVNWLRVNYALGADYSADDRLSIRPKQSASISTGAITRATFTNRIIDSNLSATATWNVGENVIGSTTVGQSLQETVFRRNQTDGEGLIRGSEQTDFAVSNLGNEYKWTKRNDGYYAMTEVTLADQLTLNVNGRLDGSSTFGGDGERFFYPGAGVSWVFSKLPAFDRFAFLDLGKVRGSWGVSGREPPVYSNVPGFTTGTMGDTYITGGLGSIYLGQEGVFTNTTLHNPDIEPERKTEWEAGLDLAFLDRRVAFGATYYNRQTRDAILALPVSISTGYEAKWVNAAEFDNSGWELTMEVNPVRRERFNWTLNAQWAKNESCVKSLAGAEHYFLSGFSGGSAVEVVAPDADGTCHPFGVHFGSDFIRFGRGIKVGGVDIDQEYGGRPGELYIGANGFPVQDAQYRVVGDPNPDWTGSLRSTFDIGQNLSVSGLIDIKHGGDMWNGTRGALYTFGTHEETLAWRGAGKDTAWTGAGPGCEDGVCKTVKLNHYWGRGAGGGFGGPMSQFMEDAGFVKLRDISLTYTFRQPFVSRLGFTALDLTVSGRNLHTWTNYRGLDPETNLTGQSTGRGLDYFNNPQTRSYVLSVNLSR